jgi:hypothetical protein
MNQKRICLTEGCVGSVPIRYNHCQNCRLKKCHRINIDNITCCPSCRKVLSNDNPDLKCNCIKKAIGRTYDSTHNEKNDVTNEMIEYYDNLLKLLYFWSSKLDFLDNHHLSMSKIELSSEISQLPFLSIKQRKIVDTYWPDHILPRSNNCINQLYDYSDETLSNTSIVLEILPKILDKKQDELWQTLQKLSSCLGIANKPFDQLRIYFKDNSSQRYIGMMVIESDQSTKSANIVYCKSPNSMLFEALIKCIKSTDVYNAFGYRFGYNYTQFRILHGYDFVDDELTLSNDTENLLIPISVLEKGKMYLSSLGYDLSDLSDFFISRLIARELDVEKYWLYQQQNYQMKTGEILNPPDMSYSDMLLHDKIIIQKTSELPIKDLYRMEYHSVRCSLLKKLNKGVITQYITNLQLLSDDNVNETTKEYYTLENENLLTNSLQFDMYDIHQSKNIGTDNPNYGKQLSLQHRTRISLAKLGHLNKRPIEDFQKIRELHAKGIINNQIAKQLNIDHSTVADVINGKMFHPDEITNMSNDEYKIFAEKRIKNVEIDIINKSKTVEQRNLDSAKSRRFIQSIDCMIDLMLYKFKQTDDKNLITQKKVAEIFKQKYDAKLITIDVIKNSWSTKKFFNYHQSEFVDQKITYEQFLSLKNTERSINPLLDDMLISLIKTI